MKKNLKFFAGALTTSIVLGGGILASCTSEESNGLLAGSNVISLAKAPNVVAYSGDMVFGNTFANKGIATRSISVNTNYFKMNDGSWETNFKNAYPNLANYTKYAPSTTDNGESVSLAEKEYVLNYIHENNGSNVAPNITDYFIQNVGSHGHSYDLGQDQNGASHTSGMQMDLFIINGDQVPDYNAQGGPRALLINVPLQNIQYHDSYGDVNQYKENAYQFYYITLPNEPEVYGSEAGKTCLYIGLDYRTEKNDGTQYDGNNSYCDWVVKIIPADGSAIKIPGSNDNCPHCDHPNSEHNDGICSHEGCTEEQCQENSSNTPGTGNDEGTWTYEPRNEVEVNLSVNDPSEEGDFASHLSIHVRYGTDVEVFIPMPEEYYCDVDDMLIVTDHNKEGNYAYGGSETKNVVTYDIMGTTVTLNITFGVTRGDQNGILIQTDGITQDLIDALWEENNDGITFEIWNYFNKEHTRDQVKGYLDQAQIKFLDGTPDYYVNAFEKERDKVYDENGKATEGKVVQDGEKETIFSWDCTVTPVDETLFKDPIVGEWLNGSPFNQIYENKNHTTTPSEE